METRHSKLLNTASRLIHTIEESLQGLSLEEARQKFETDPHIQRQARLLLQVNSALDRYGIGESVVLTARQLLENFPRSIIERPSLIAGGIMGREEKRITYAHPKHLKTMESLWEGFHVASGRDYLDYGVTQGKVLYIGLEGTLEKLRPRIIKMMQNFPEESWDNLHFAILRPRERSIGKIEELIREYEPDLTIIDPLTSLLRKEDKKEDVEGLLNELDRLIDAYHTSIHVIHHSRKSTGTMETLENMRGSTALPGWADTICRVSRVNNNKDKIKLSWETRYGEQELEDMTLDFDRERCSFSEDVTLLPTIRSKIGRMVYEARARGERLYTSKVKEELEDEASERTIAKAIHSMEQIAIRIDETDRRKRYLELVDTERTLTLVE